MFSPYLPKNSFLFINDYADINNYESTLGLAIYENGKTHFYKYNTYTGNIEEFKTINLEIKQVAVSRSPYSPIGLFEIDSGGREKVGFLAPVLMSYLDYLLSLPLDFGLLQEDAIVQASYYLQSNDYFGDYSLNEMFGKLYSLNHNYIIHLVRLVLFFEFFYVKAINAIRGIRGNTYVITSLDRLFYQTYFNPLPNKLPQLWFDTDYNLSNILYVEGHLDYYHLTDFVSVILGSIEQIKSTYLYVNSGFPRSCLGFNSSWANYIETPTIPEIGSIPPFIDFKLSSPIVGYLQGIPSLGLLNLYLLIQQLFYRVYSSPPYDRKLYIPVSPFSDNICTAMKQPFTLEQVEEKLIDLMDNFEQKLINDVIEYTKQVLSIDSEPKIDGLVADIMQSDLVFLPLFSPTLSTNFGVKYLMGWGI